MPLVTVTGGTGLIGALVVQQLLEQGHDVRATVRDPQAAKCEFLRALGRAASSKGKLTLMKGDLNKAGSFEEAMTGADVVIHCAAQVQMHFDKCPFKEVISPAIDGTRDIALTAKKLGIKRIVFTGSQSSIVQLEENREPKFRGKPFVEDERRFDLRPAYATYQCAKAASENVMNEEFPGEVISILPAWCVGPQLPKDPTSSHQLLKGMAMKELPMAPLLYTSWVDLRDVAAAHVHAAFAPMPSGGKLKHRYILSQGDLVCALDFAKSVAKQFPHLSPPAKMTPWWLLWCMSWWDKRVGPFLLHEKSQKLPPSDGSRITRELGFQYKYTKLDETIKIAIETMMEHGCITKK